MTSARAYALRVWWVFQSTLPTRGSDGKARCARLGAWHFNPRSPRGGATSSWLYNHRLKYISIHAPHEGERRRVFYAYKLSCRNFNPRSPRGGATCSSCCICCCNAFQSTLPTRGSDQRFAVLRCDYAISIHAPHEGERHARGSRAGRGRQFQSTLPTRGSDFFARRIIR